MFGLSFCEVTMTFFMHMFHCFVLFSQIARLEAADQKMIQEEARRRNRDGKGKNAKY